MSDGAIILPFGAAAHGETRAADDFVFAIEPLSTVPCTMSCFYCPAQSTWRTREEAQAAAVWHVHDTHPEAWRRVIGDRPPLDERPDPARRLG